MPKDSVIYVAGNQVKPIREDKDGHLVIEFAGNRYSGTYTEWVLFARNLSLALDKVRNY